MDLAEDEGDDNSQQERSQGQGRTLSSLPRGERLELEPGGASGGAEEGPPEVKPDHRRCILHFDIDCFYAQARINDSFAAERARWRPKQASRVEGRGPLRCLLELL